MLWGEVGDFGGLLGELGKSERKCAFCSGISSEDCTLRKWKYQCESVKEVTNVVLSQE